MTNNGANDTKAKNNVANKKTNIGKNPGTEKSAEENLVNKKYNKGTSIAKITIILRSLLLILVFPF